ncbi:hypothetical protein PENTCL1PPCAC_11090, partial [Pristionchus entomophagus]
LASFSLSFFASLIISPVTAPFGQFSGQSGGGLIGRGGGGIWRGGGGISPQWTTRSRSSLSTSCPTRSRTLPLRSSSLSPSLLKTSRGLPSRFRSALISILSARRRWSSSRIICPRRRFISSITLSMARRCSPFMRLYAAMISFSPNPSSNCIPSNCCIGAASNSPKIQTIRSHTISISGPSSSFNK